MPSADPPTPGLGQALVLRGRAWWHVVHLGALVLALLVSPASYRRGRWPRLAQHLVQASAPLLVWFSLLSALVSVVLIHIVLVTALSYGLSQYAMQMVVRVLVLELIPLSAAMAVALRVSVPAAAELAALRRGGGFDALRASGLEPLHHEILPRALGGLFAVLLLAAVSSVLALVLTYLAVHGFSPWGFERFTRTVGQVFSPAVSLIFCLKTLAFAAAVALIPLGSSLHEHPGRFSPLPLELQGLVRMFVVIILIEVASLVGNYY